MTARVEPPWQELRAGLRTFLARRVRNDADVDDLVQRVLLRIVAGLPSLRDGDRLYPWVYRTARNVLIDHYRAAGARRDQASGDIADLEAIAPAPGDDRDRDAAGVRELSGCLAPMLRGLAPAYRDAVTLADLEGVPQAEAARRAGISVSGLKSRVQRGRRQLRTALETCCRAGLDAGGSVTFDRAKAGACGSCGDPLVSAAGCGAPASPPTRRAPRDRPASPDASRSRSAAPSCGPPRGRTP